jgi:ribosome-associated translation inhibitor RaiA
MIMQVLLNTDSNVTGSEALAKHVEAVVIDALNRFGTQVTRVEVHLGNEASGKGADAKTCVMEARLAGREPAVVSHEAATLSDAIEGASVKLERLLESALGRLADH